MKKSLKIYLVNPQTESYEKMFKALGFEFASNPLAADVINFQGGADVSPYLYGQDKHFTSNCNPARDTYETQVYKLALAKRKSFIGICRGGQFLNVMNGGQLWQNIDNHTSSHLAYDHLSGKSYWVTSTHHQQMIPANGAEKLLSVERGLCLRKESDKRSISRSDKLNVTSNEWEDIEALWYPETKSLCFQPHPEFHFGPGWHKEVFEVFESYVQRFIVEDAA